MSNTETQFFDAANGKLTKRGHEKVGIAFDLLSLICDSTNWTDAGELKAAVKAERRERRDLQMARAAVVRGWLLGFQQPDMPASLLYQYRDGYRAAILLGARHAVERANHDSFKGPCGTLATYAEAVREGLAV